MGQFGILRSVRSLGSTTSSPWGTTFVKGTPARYILAWSCDPEGSSNQSANSLRVHEDRNLLYTSSMDRSWRDSPYRSGLPDDLGENDFLMGINCSNAPEVSTRVLKSHPLKAFVRVSGTCVRTSGKFVPVSGSSKIWSHFFVLTVITDRWSNMSDGTRHLRWTYEMKSPLWSLGKIIRLKWRKKTSDTGNWTPASTVRALYPNH